MTKPSLILIGDGGHALSCIDVIERQNFFEIAGLVGSTFKQGMRTFDYEILGTDAQLSKYVNKYEYALVAVGQIESSGPRIRIYQELIRLGFKVPTIISPLAYVSSRAIVGDGTIIMHGAVVNAGAIIGSNCIINSRALIEHDVMVRSHCHVSTGAILNGGVKVDEGSFIGSGSTVKEATLIGRDCLIGAGLFVNRNIENNIKYKGRIK